MKNKLNYAVIGSGSWATAIVKILSDNLKSVTWYIRNAENLDYIEKNKHNPNYLNTNSADNHQWTATHLDLLHLLISTQNTKRNLEFL